MRFFIVVIFLVLFVAAAAVSALCLNFLIVSHITAGGVKGLICSQNLIKLSVFAFLNISFACFSAWMSGARRLGLRLKFFKPAFLCVSASLHSGFHHGGCGGDWLGRFFFLRFGRWCAVLSCSMACTMVLTMSE